MTAFATGFERPVTADGYPLSLAVAIAADVRQPLYFERVYRSASGEQLAIRATLVGERGLVLLTEKGPSPAGTASIETSVTNQNRATEPDPVIAPEEVMPQPVRFATAVEQPVMRGSQPLHLAIGIGSTRQVVYLERVYLDAGRRQIAIRSDVVYDRELLAGFNIHQPEPPLGTRWIETSLTNQYRATEAAATLEYESLEWNELEYN